MESAKDISRSCPICYEDADTMAAPLLSTTHCCKADYCLACWQVWLEQCERNGTKTACPGCRTELTDEIVEKLLGRPPRKQSEDTEPDIRVSEDEVSIDEFTRTYLESNNFMQCGNCGFWIEKTEGCAAMICLCGHRFCYECRVAADECRCGDCADPADFYDNTLLGHLGDFLSTDDINSKDGHESDDDSSASTRRALGVATEQQLLDLKSFLERRRRVAEG